LRRPLCLCGELLGFLCALSAPFANFAIKSFFSANSASKEVSSNARCPNRPLLLRMQQRINRSPDLCLVTEHA
jgi:hypothetical protein